MAGGKWLPTALLAGLFLGSLTPPQSAAAATLTPVSPTVVAGNSVTLTLDDTILASIPPASDVAVVTLLISFNQSLLTLTSVVNGALLVNWDAPKFNVNTGLISISEGLNGDDAVGKGSIVTLTFKALASDPTILTPVSLQTAPTAHNPTAGALGEYQLDLTSDSVSITAAPVTPPTTVPEPGTVVLLLAPMLAAACLKRRDRC